MGHLIRTFDWSTTPVGPISRWSGSLRTALGILLNSRHPMFLWWGSELVQFYNNGYRPSLGADGHPAALGARGREFWAGIWPTIGPQIEAVMARGRPTWHDDDLVPIFRNGRIEEVYWTYGYSPVHDDDGGIGGTLVVVQEQTRRVLSERRLRTLRDLAGVAASSQTESGVWAGVLATLADNAHDIPWALCYAIGNDGRVSRLRGHTLVASSADAAALTGEASFHHWTSHLQRVADSGQPVLMTDVCQRFGDIAGPRWPEPVQTAWMIPIRRPGTSILHGVLVAGISPRLTLDEEYWDFLVLAADQVATALTNARLHEEEIQRAESLAELDQVKTRFFANVSHEFRTPLSLLLGPTEEALASPERTLAGDDLEMVHRNELRLLKLVNTLLDFASIEAGRGQARYEPTDLAALTLDLASAFRSTIERAGLTFNVDCPTLPEPVYVDRDMWEKIVLNLLSNAIKFTFTGSIEVCLRWRQTHVDLAVRDTGVGIPAEELTHVFERFHRVEGVRGRTHEGSGIGLALVQELLRMHGGSAQVSSTVGEGTTFKATIPTGTAHLSGVRVTSGPATARTGNSATPFVSEALRWLPDTVCAEHFATGGGDPARRLWDDATAVQILVADDNADMRDYIRRLLGVRWRVTAVADGVEALSAARGHRPDLVITDVMMPGLDGFALLRQLRADAATRFVPVILLTARAGEEARIDGLATGADDYLVKPFAARELIARVEAQLAKGKIRAVEEEHTRRLDAVFRHAPVGIAILRGPEHVFQFANPAYLDLVSGRAIIGKAARTAFPELATQGIFQLLDGVYESGRPHVGRGLRVSMNRAERGGAEEAFFDFVCQPTFDDHGRVDGIAVVAFEVTEMARARREAEWANRLKELALDTGRLGTWHIDLRTRDRWSSPRCKANFGVGPDSPLPYDDVIRTMHPDDQGLVRDAMSFAIASHSDYVAEYRVIWPDGTCHWLSERGRTMYADDGEPVQMAGNTLDITEQKLLVSDLRRAGEELERRVAEHTAELTDSHTRLALALAEKTGLEQARNEWLRMLMTAQEDERRRVARELHDEMSQHLTAITLGLHALAADTLDRPDALVASLQELVARLDRGMHRLARDLRPAELDDLGLVSAVDAYVEEWSRLTGIAADFSSRNCEERLPAHVESALYRIVQEAMTNVARHAEAARASVVIESRHDRVVVVVEDDGRGFDASVAPGRDNLAGLGLVGIHERAALLGGTATIESGPGGTSVFVALPLASHEGHA